MSIACPHCGEIMHIRDSRSVSIVSRQSYYRCSNLNCGHRAVGITELIGTVVPANIPNPQCNLKMVTVTSSKPVN
ncbi:ogr/Delta-like zinc finger family protein [uncultured Deefgea sp.]|uniref:ogr/Delta-like zinc finger family protein n=1 Tax=uncultured Deefgea sp. TaxID=1304914 RepID=UPI0035B53C2D